MNGKTVITITHDNEIASQASEIIKIKDGRFYRLIPKYILSNLFEARINLLETKQEHFLTSLGIIIGITSVIILIAITNGAKSVIETQLTSLVLKQ